MRFVAIMVVTVGVLAVGLFTTKAGKVVREYATVVYRWSQNGRPERYYFELELERLGLKVEQATEELEANHRVLVNEAVRITGYARGVETAKEELVEKRRLLRKNRDQYTKQPAGKVTAEAGAALKQTLATYKAQCAKVEAMESALAQLKSTYTSMTSAQQELSDKRDLLRDQLEVLRVKVEALRISGNLQRSSLSDSSVREAAELADQIDDKIEFQRRIRSGLLGLELDSERQDSTLDAEPDLAELEAILKT
jgi:hypothetical protein